MALYISWSVHFKIIKLLICNLSSQLYDWTWQISVKVNIKFLLKPHRFRAVL
jgi:hypothetical protein